MKRRHERTLEAVYAKPSSASLRFDDFRSLMVALEAQVLEREGSRVAFILMGKVLVMHRPHPSPEMDKGAVDDARKFLVLCSVKPGGT